MTMINTVLGIAALIAAASAETIHGVALVNRHGDRTSKHYADYQLTNLGYRQSLDAGSFFRSTYVADGAPKKILGMSSDTYIYTQLSAVAPDQQILLKTTTAFLQGIYPPLSPLAIASTNLETLTNGSTYTTPTTAQYIFLRSRVSNSPDTIWIKGDEQCPLFTSSSATFKSSTLYTDLLTSTKPFYASLFPLLSGVYDYTTPTNLSFAKAYDIYDLLNVASIHNSSLAHNITAPTLAQLRKLADIAEHNTNFNATQPARNIGGAALAGALLTQLNQTVTSKGGLKFSVFTPSYNNILSLSGLLNITFPSSPSPSDVDAPSIPPYASTLAFELFTPTSTSSFPSNLGDLSIRAVCRNGSEGAGAPLVVVKMFDGLDSMRWVDFQSKVGSWAVKSTKEWCGVCGSQASFCVGLNGTTAAASPSASASASSSSGNGSGSGSGSGSGGMSNVLAGAIGALVTLGLVLFLGVAFLGVRILMGKKQAVPVVGLEKKTSLSSAEI